MSLIGKNNHQSVLDDNSSLYKPQVNKSEKQKWSELDKQQRKQYFLDYYLIKCIIIIFAAGIVITLLWNFFSPKKEILLSVSILQNSLSTDEKENFQLQLTDLLVTDADKQEIRIDDNYPEGYESEIKLQAYLSGQDVDLIIADEEHFSQLASFGYFEDLSFLLPDTVKKYGDLLYWTSGYSEENTADNTVISDHSSNLSSDHDLIKAYGVRVTNHDFFKSAAPGDVSLIAGIVVNSTKKNNSVTAIDFLAQ